MSVRKRHGAMALAMGQYVERAHLSSPTGRAGAAAVPFEAYLANRKGRRLVGRLALRRARRAEKQRRGAE